MLKSLFLFFCLSLSLSACAENSNTNKNTPFKPGDIAFIGADQRKTFIAKDEESLNTLVSGSNSEKASQINQLMAVGKVVLINRKTKVSIVKPGKALEIKILDGDYQGLTFWVTEEMLAST